RFGGDPPAWAEAVDSMVEPLHIVGPYGLFAVMTTRRYEIVIQGSKDGVEWRDYEFRYKPGNVARRPLWNIPHQPRLDWQMWFAALDDPRSLPWFWRFLERLLQNEPTVMTLLKRNPFPDKPPIYVRAQFYDYTFAKSEERSEGQWWDRQLLGLYFPAVHLKGNDSFIGASKALSHRKIKGLLVFRDCGMMPDCSVSPGIGTPMLSRL